MRRSWAGLLVIACVSYDKGPESSGPDEVDEKADSQYKPTARGPIGVNDTQLAELSAEERYQSWTFTLTGPASVNVSTSTGMRNHAVDTVLYLHKKNSAGTWGSYIARNDDRADDDLFSEVQKSLTAGEYRVLIKGYSATEYGRFAVHVRCEGSGCAAQPCLFTNLEPVIGPVTTATRSLAAEELTSRDEARLLMSIRQTALSHVVKGADVLTSLAGEVTEQLVYDSVGARALSVHQFFAGGEAYAVAYDFRNSEPVAVQKGEQISVCRSAAQRCALGANWSELRYHKGFSVVTEKAVTATSTLTARQREQLLRAFQSADEDINYIAAGFDRADEGQVSVVRLKKAGLEVDAVVFGAGDNTYGAVFRKGRAELLTHIIDLDFLSCRVAE